MTSSSEEPSQNEEARSCSSDHLSKKQSVILIQSTVRRWLCLREYKQRSKMVTKRKNVANEILHTEKEYTGNLGILVESFLKPALEKENAKYLEAQLNNEIVLSLSGVEVIYKFHLELLSDLDKIVKTWSPSSALGAIFLSMAFYLKSYSTYVNHYQNVVQLLAKRKTDKNLQAMLESLKPQATGKGIKDYLIMPIQRIPRYQMLLHELVKSTWKSHMDYDNLVQAQAKVQEVAILLENKSADVSSIARVMELSSLFSRKDNFKLLVPHRRYIDETQFSDTSNNMKDLTIFLFNDLVIWAKPKKEKYTIKKIIHLNTTVVTPSTEQPGKFVFTNKQSSDTSEEVFMVIPEAKHKKWTGYFQSIAQGQKIWLPHTITKEDKIISIQKRESPREENQVPTPPPLPMTKKKRFLGFLKASPLRDELVKSQEKVTLVTRSKSAVYPTNTTAVEKTKSENITPDAQASPILDLDSSSDSSIPQRRYTEGSGELFDNIMEEVEALGESLCNSRERSNARQYDLDSLREFQSIPEPPPLPSAQQKRSHIKRKRDLQLHHTQSADTYLVKQKENFLQDIKSSGNKSSASKSGETRAEAARCLERKLGQKNVGMREFLLKDIQSVNVDNDSNSTVVTSAPKPSKVKKSRRSKSNKKYSTSPVKLEDPKAEENSSNLETATDDAPVPVLRDVILLEDPQVKKSPRASKPRKLRRSKKEKRARRVSGGESPRGTRKRKSSKLTTPGGDEKEDNEVSFTEDSTSDVTISHSESHPDSCASVSESTIEELPSGTDLGLSPSLPDRGDSKEQRISKPVPIADELETTNTLLEPDGSPSASSEQVPSVTTQDTNPPTELSPTNSEASANSLQCTESGTSESNVTEATPSKLEEVETPVASDKSVLGNEAHRLVFSQLISKFKTMESTEALNKVQANRRLSYIPKAQQTNQNETSPHTSNIKADVATDSGKLNPTHSRLQAGRVASANLDQYCKDPPS